ncbi:hypothetical protein LCGC14_2233260 [marine sediment metagenome]|uniref:Double zinc ribbon domain-containing protein n=1 Tax=marine sediment metagenome TaxID=412755 RepID=A0A0F9DV80_9ZZZZ
MGPNTPTCLSPNTGLVEPREASGLSASHCPRCRTTFMPPDQDCGRCGSHVPDHLKPVRCLVAEPTAPVACDGCDRTLNLTLERVVYYASRNVWYHQKCDRSLAQARNGFATTARRLKGVRDGQSRKDCN